MGTRALGADLCPADLRPSATSCVSHMPPNSFLYIQPPSRSQVSKYRLVYRESPDTISSGG